MVPVLLSLLLPKSYHSIYALHPGVLTYLQFVDFSC